MELNETNNLVELCIKKLGVDAEKCRGDKPGQWSLKKDSSDVWIDVFKNETNQSNYFQVMSPVIKVTDSNTQNFFQDVLEMNYDLYGMACVKFKNWIYLKIIRETEGLDESEIDKTLSRIAFYSDDIYKKLSFKYKNDYMPVNNTPGASKDL